MNRSRLCVAAVAVLLTLSMLVPGTALADCNDGLLSCQTDAERTRGGPVTLEAVSTVLTLREDPSDPQVHGRAVSTYYAMLRGVDMPAGEAPAVGVAVRRTTPVGGDPVMESTVALRASRGGENGWLVVSRVVDTGVGDHHEVGVVAVEGTGELAQETATMSTLDGTAVVVLSFEEGGTSDDGQVAFATRTEPTFGVTPLVTGDTPWRVTQSARPTVPLRDLAGDDPLAAPGLTTVAEPLAGQVAYQLDGDLNLVNEDLPAVLPAGASLADVVDVDGIAAGVSWTAEATLVEQADNTDDARGPLPVAPPILPSNVVIAASDPNNGGVVSYMNNDLTIPRGTSVLLANFDSTFPHPIVCSDALTGAKRYPEQCLTDDTDVTGERPGGDKGGTVSVVHTENLEPGVYYFVCQIHAGSFVAGTQMSGRITVV